MTLNDLAKSGLLRRSFFFTEFDSCAGQFCQTLSLSSNFPLLAKTYAPCSAVSLQ